MSRPKRDDAKSKTLRDTGTLNPHPERVTDERFGSDRFFDPRDLVQVKYEMLKRSRIEGEPVAKTACAFGLSRPTFYKAQQDYEKRGLAGLLPAKRGPRRAHKLTEDVMGLVRHELAAEPSLGAPELARRIEERLSVTVHPRSIERALARKQKKTK